MPLLLCLRDQIRLARLGVFDFLLKFVQLLPSIRSHPFDDLIADLLVLRLTDLIRSPGLVIPRLALLAKVETHDAACVLRQHRHRWRGSRPRIAPHVGRLVLHLYRHSDATPAALQCLKLLRTLSHLGFELQKSV